MKVKAQKSKAETRGRMAKMRARGEKMYEEGQEVW